MKGDIYRTLARHLDSLPGGFPPSKTGADLRLLKMLFTPEEAELAVHLTPKTEDAGAIAGRANVPSVAARTRLDEMAQKGLVFSVQREDGTALYQAVPFVVGIYEFQVNNLTGELVRALGEYWSTEEERPPVQTIPQMRTIPVGKSIEFHVEALPYERVGEIVKSRKRFAVAPCICRRHAGLTRGSCAAPEEACLMFDEWADYYVRGERGRYIEQSEVMDILARADAANLVLQPSNSREVCFICCCCGCCCGVLRGLQRHSRPAEVVVSQFTAALEPEDCDGCLVCLERCQMQALTSADGRVALDADRCIGCGLCVTTCAGGALRLVRRPGSERASIPETMQETWRAISEAEAKRL
ncbi:MAG: 4Fe-4S binding protein [Candidatus Eisenbacteria bacterium]